MPKVLNGKLIVLKWQNIHAISNIKYTTIYSKTDQAVYFTFSRGIFRTLPNVRSSRLEMFCRKGVLRNFAKFTRKRLCQSLFFRKVTGLRPATLLKKRLWHRSFPVNFTKFLKIPFSTEHLRWLLYKRLSKAVVSLEVNYFHKKHHLRCLKRS